MTSSGIGRFQDVGGKQFRMRVERAVWKVWRFNTGAGTWM